MNYKSTYRSFLLLVLLLTLSRMALASTTWYVDGVHGSNANNCKTPTTACKIIGHAISMAASGDTVMVAPATYTENLTISISLKIVGFAASTTIIDGGSKNTVVTISGSARESGGHRDFGGFGVLDGQESSSRRCWGNVGTRVRCGFPSAEGEPRISG